MAGLDNAIKSGAEAIMIIADMLDYIHMASRIAAGGSITDLPESEQAELDHMAKDITLSRLARAWQIMLKGHGEVNLAPDPHAAADMVLIRLAHVANMPTPGDLVKKLKDVTPDMLASSAPASSAPASSAPASSAPVSSTPAEQWPDQDMPPPMVDMPDHSPGHMAPAPSAPSSSQLASPQPVPEKMNQMAQIFEDHGELKLASYLRTRIRPVLLEAGRFEFSADRPLDESVPGQIGYFLTEWTGMRWMVSVATQSGSDTLDEIEHAQKQSIRDILAADPIVKSAMDTFPDSTIHSITPLSGMVTLTEDPADLSDAGSSDDDEKKADHA
jgi:DNA polymerase-3 subunit gamma/tau